MMSFDAMYWLPGKITLVALLSFIMLSTIPRISMAQAVSKEDERIIKEGIAGFMKEFEQFLNDIGNSNKKIEEKNRIINERFSYFFKNEEVNIEQDLNPKGKDRSVKVKPARIYLNNLGVFNYNTAFTIDSLNINGIYLTNNDLFVLATFQRSFEAIDRDGKYLKSTSLERQIYFDLKKDMALDEWVWKIRSISFAEEKNLDRLRIDIAQEGLYIELSSPVRGYRLQKGSPLEITWTSNLEEDVKIELYRGNSPDRLITKKTPNNGSYPDWVVPSDLTEGVAYKIRVSSTVNDNISSSSKNLFVTNSTNTTSVGPSSKNTNYILAGVNTGLAFHSISGENWRGESTQQNMDVGFMLGYTMGNNFYVLSGLKLIGRGGQADFSQNRQTLSLRYLEIPAIFHYLTSGLANHSFKFHFGPSLHLLRNSSFTLTNTNGNGNNSTKTQLDQEITKSEVGLNVGIGYYIPFGKKIALSTDINYYYGLGSLLREPIPGSNFNISDLYSNRAFGISLNIFYAF